MQMKLHKATERVAFRSAHPEGAWNAWLVADTASGSHWASSGEVSDWTPAHIVEDAQ